MAQNLVKKLSTETDTYQDTESADFADFRSDSSELAATRGFDDFGGGRANAVIG
jgi:hypothetical protein